jgi:hypothetical protein
MVGWNLFVFVRSDVTNTPKSRGWLYYTQLLRYSCRSVYQISIALISEVPTLNKKLRIAYYLRKKNQECPEEFNFEFGFNFRFLLFMHYYFQIYYLYTHYLISLEVHKCCLCFSSSFYYFYGCNFYMNFYLRAKWKISLFIVTSVLLKSCLKISTHVKR